MRLTEEQIGAELHALRETPTERFAAELDERVSAGFPDAPERRASSWRERLAPLGRPRMLVAYAATLLLALTVSIAVVSSLDDEQRTADIRSGSEVGEQSAPDAGRGTAAKPLGESAPRVNEDSGAIEPVPGGGVVAPEPVTPVPPQDQLKPGQERIQERSASMTLSTEPGMVDDVADGVVEVVERYDGIVVSSNVSTSDGEGRASFDLRIPTQNLRAALAELSDLADVSSRDEGTLDITAPFVTVEERFDDAKVEVDALLDQLAEAESASEIASIRQQLQLARSELAAARADLGALKQRADFSRLSVAVVGNGDGDGWSIGDAAGDAVDVLEALGGAALVTLAVLIPLGGIAALLWFGLRALRRRDRERTLDKS